MTLYLAPREPGRLRKLANAVRLFLWNRGLTGRRYQQIGYTTEGTE